jgi:hypothetical protein
MHYFFKIHFNTILQFTPESPKSSSFSGHPTHLILRHLITLITFGEEYNLESSILFTFLQPPLTSLLCPNILSSLFSNILSLFRPLILETKFHTHKNYRKLYVFIIYVCFT